MKKTFLGRVFYVFLFCAILWIQAGIGAPYSARKAEGAAGLKIYSPAPTAPYPYALTSQTPVRVCYSTGEGNFCEFAHLKEGENKVTITDGANSDFIIIVLDTEKPFITIAGENPLDIPVGSSYSDAGASATDSREGDLTGAIRIYNPVNPAAPGTYEVTYDVADEAGNQAEQKIRTVNVIEASTDSDGDGIADESDNCIYAYNPDQADRDGEGTGDLCDEKDDSTKDETAPKITLLGPDKIDIYMGEDYEDLGATAEDDTDGNITALMQIVNSVNTNVAGTYYVIYDVKDSAGNDAEQIRRTVNVINKKGETGGTAILPKFAPADANIILDGGNEKTTKREVIVSLTAEGAVQMAISNFPDFSDSVWEKYSPAISWSLPGGEGTKNVYVKFKNNAGAESKTYSASIFLEEMESSGMILGVSDTKIADGDMVQCRSCADPDAVYIVKIFGDNKYARRIDPEILSYYPHLNRKNPKQIESMEGFRETFWIRVNTGADGTAKPTDKVYEINGDGTRHWLDMDKEKFYAMGGSEEMIFSVTRKEMDYYKNGPSVTAA